jgi:hypothetical protein
MLPGNDPVLLLREPGNPLASQGQVVDKNGVLKPTVTGAEGDVKKAIGWTWIGPPV